MSSVVASTQFMDFKDAAVDPPVPGSLAPTKGSEVVQPWDTAGPVAGWSIQSCSNCTINITLESEHVLSFSSSMYSKTLLLYKVTKSFLNENKRM